MPGSVLFLVPYPKQVAPSQRFRVELYEQMLQEAGIKYDIASFLDRKTWDVLFRKGHYLQKVTGIVRGYFRRISHLIKALKFDNIFIHREAAPLGPPIFEWILSRVLRKKIIYDFDDAIWIPNVSRTNRWAGLLKSHWKVKYICKWADIVTAGNQYLFDYANQYCKKTILLPTCVDIDKTHNRLKEHHSGKPVVGWTGSHSTLFYLNSIIPVVKDLQKERDFTFVVIADKKPQLELKDWEYIKWSEAKEAEDLMKIDIGIMPLKEDAWSRGKCGFKLIQYLSCGIPALADPIGVNKEIIEEGINGFVCKDLREWKEKLSLLLTSPAIRNELGRNGRAGVVENYSIQSQRLKFLSLFR